MRVSRRADWGWNLESMWVIMTTDHAAGPNPGRQGILDADKANGESEGVPLMPPMLYYGHQQVADGGEEEEDPDEEEWLEVVVHADQPT